MQNDQVSSAVKQEIQRFESVHPSIYRIYDLIEALEDKQLLETIRDHVVAIEDSFVNSQEWTISRNVPELRVGVIGSLRSGKSALVHRYLTGSYLTEESPEGGRFKKEVAVEGRSHLLLIRDEGQPPDEQFANWCDACMLVFALDNVDSFYAVGQLLQRLLQLRQFHELPLMLVGTQDSISESKPRAIEEATAQKLVQRCRSCCYRETCATYGYNVDRVFTELCSRIVTDHFNRSAASPARDSKRSDQGVARRQQITDSPIDLRQQQQQQDLSKQKTEAATPHAVVRRRQRVDGQKKQRPVSQQLTSGVTEATPLVTLRPKRPLRRTASVVTGLQPAPDAPMSRNGSVNPVVGVQSVNPGPFVREQQQQSPATETGIALRQPSHRNSAMPLLDTKDAASSLQPPEKQQQQKRHSNLFNRRTTHNNKNHSNNHNNNNSNNSNTSPTTAASGAAVADEAAVGHGRAIPVKQGQLHKKSGNALNREWKKKYATLGADGRLTYYPSLHDYMNDCHGKSMELVRTTVKRPGQLAPTSNGLLMPDTAVQGGKSQQQQRQKRQRKRTRSGQADDADAGDWHSFSLVSLDGPVWQFGAAAKDELCDWVEAIERAILLGLESAPSASSSQPGNASLDAIRALPGNDRCADCGRAEPNWASLNLGAMLCIECSGLHRQLGTHLSRVRSLTLDAWPSQHLLVMRLIGNRLANSVWEAQLAQSKVDKPSPDSGRATKEAFVRAKYVAGQFLPPLPFPGCPLQQQLIDAIARSDTQQVVLCLSQCSSAINERYSAQDQRTALHIVATLGHVGYAQLLMWYGADAAVVDGHGRTPEEYAVAAAQHDTAMFLKQSRASGGSTAAAPAAGVLAAAPPTLPRRRPGTTDTGESGDREK